MILGAEEVGDLARHVENDRQLRGQDVREIGGRVLGQQVGDGGSDGAAADVGVAGEGGDGATFQVRGAHGVGLVSRDGGAAAAFLALRLGGSQAVVGQLSLEVTLEFTGGGEGPHHELHGGQQLAGTRVAGGEVHRGERAVVDAQGETVAVQDVEDVPGATQEAEHLGDVHGVARPRVRQQLAELRPLQRVKAAGSPGLLLENDRVLDPALVQRECQPLGR
jgi:hypothetical protein